MPFPVSHALDLLHPTPCGASAVGKPGDALGKYLIQPSNQPSDDPHDIPQQSVIGRMVDVGFADRGVDAEFFAVLQSEIDCRPHYQVVDGLYCLGPDSVKGSAEGIVLFGHRPAVEPSEATQRKGVGDPVAELAIVPVFNPPENKGAEGLLGC